MPYRYCMLFLFSTPQHSILPQLLTTPLKKTTHSSILLLLRGFSSECDWLWDSNLSSVTGLHFCMQQRSWHSEVIKVWLDWKKGGWLGQELCCFFVIQPACWLNTFTRDTHSRVFWQCLAGLFGGGCVIQMTTTLSIQCCCPNLMLTFV